MLHRRSIFLINKKFQLRFSLFVCSWLVAIGLAYPVLIYNLFEYFIRFLNLDPSDLPMAQIQKLQSQVIAFLIISELIVVSLTFGISVFISHKVAGPIYKLREYFHMAQKGYIDEPLHFRTKDFFHEVAEDYNAMIQAFKTRIDQNEQAIRTTIPIISKSLSLCTPEARHELEVALAALQKAQKNAESQ